MFHSEKKKEEKEGKLVKSSILDDKHSKLSNLHISNIFVKRHALNYFSGNHKARQSALMKKVKNTVTRKTGDLLMC
jgi:hypothetical protein